MGILVNTGHQITMAEEKKSFLKSIKNVFKWHHKRGKKSKEPNIEKGFKSEEVSESEVKVTPVDVLLEKLDKKEDENEEENELENFTHKLIDEEPRASIESQSSIDSGFAEKGADNDKESYEPTGMFAEELTKKFSGLKVDEENEKTKKKTLQTVVISRGPVKHNSSHAKSHPYALKQDEYRFGQTQNLGHFQTQVNTHTLSGGNVIVNDNNADNISLAQAVNDVDQSVKLYTKTTKDEQELIRSVADEFLSSVFHDMDPLALSNTFDYSSDAQIGALSPESNSTQFQTFQTNYDPTLSQLNYIGDDYQSFYKSSIFPTPPRSENVPSPMSDSYYPTCVDYISSPSTSSPMGNPDLEICQPLDLIEEPRVEKKEEVSHNMKYYKDLQRRLSSNFSRKECCQNNRQTCKDIFQEHLERLEVKNRANICLNVANLEPEETFAVLRYLIVKLSESTAEEDTQLVIFCLICDKMLGRKPDLFVGDFGLELIKLAVLRCYSRPFVTRYLVHCVRVAIKLNDRIALESTHVFTELDALGDNLLHSCVRKGDECANVLSELVRKDANDMPLFNVHHSNSDGYMPLHLACSTHSVTESRLHTTHVLMEHAAANIWLQDVKGGDTALHLAVNSPHCDLHLIMILFHHFGRNEWKALAQAQNRSSASVRDYARSASKSSSRPNYSPEVLEFLKKCR